jgi:hypothetical protein
MMNVQGLVRGPPALPHIIKGTALRPSCNARVDYRPCDEAGLIERVRLGKGMGR